MRPPHARTPRRGFSLIELLIVVTLLGVIAAIVVPRISLSSDNAKDTVEDHHIAQLNGLVEQHYLLNGAWPTALTDLNATMLPDGVPVNPNGGTYTINSSTHRVEVTP